MKTIATAALCACMAMTTATVLAQSASSPAPMSTAPMSKGSMAKKGTMQDCKDRVTTQKGEKRNDTPASADTDMACGDSTASTPMHKGKMMKKSDGMKNNSGPMQEMPAAPSK